MKKYLLLLIFTASLSLTTYAQNIEMAKAFYKKALQAYEDENYKEALILIEKTKENLNGNTNPDIIYIEAKSRYKNDIDVTLSKQLFTKFLNKSSKNDERKTEVAQILVDIERLSTYHTNGKIKSFFYTEFNLERFYDKKGINTHCKVYDEKNEKLESTVFFDGNNISYYLYSKNDRNDIDIYYKQNLKQEISFDVTQNKLSFKAFENIESTNNLIIDESENFEILEFYNQNLNLTTPLFDGMKIGIVKKASVTIKNKKTIIYFNNKGIPIKKELYKNNKLKLTEFFNNDDAIPYKKSFLAKENQKIIDIKDNETVEMVLKKYFNSIGGLKKVKSVQNLLKTGIVMINKNKISYEGKQTKNINYYKMFNQDGTLMEFKENLDKQKTKQNGVWLKSGSDKKKRGEYILNSLFPELYFNKQNTNLIGMAYHNNNLNYVLKTTFDGYDFFSYYNVKNGQKTKVEYISNRNGLYILINTVLKDYKLFDGILFPTILKQDNYDTDNEILFKLNKIKINSTKIKF